MGRYYSSQAYYQSCANKHLETEQRKIMMEKLTSQFTWKQFIWEIFLIGWLIQKLLYKHLPEDKKMPKNAIFIVFGAHPLE